MQQASTRFLTFSNSVKSSLSPSVKAPRKRPSATRMRVDDQIQGDAHPFIIPKAALSFKRKRQKNTTAASLERP